MNKQRRAEIEKLQSRIAEVMTDLEAIRDEEQEYFDNMPESFQGGDKGQRVQEIIDCLEQACGDLEIIDLNTALEG